MNRKGIPEIGNLNGSNHHNRHSALTVDDKTVQLPITVGTESERAIDISQLRSRPHMSRSITAT